jgi:hypothetical protein
MMKEAQNCDFLTYILSGLSARFQLENCAPARLGSEPSLLGLARAGKFQLELISRLNIPHMYYILVAVGSSGILKAKQKLGVTFNFDKQDVIDFMRFSKMTMCRASEKIQKSSHRSFVFWAKNK